MVSTSITKMKINCLGLILCDPSQQAFRLEQDGVIQIISTPAAVVGDLVYLTDQLAQSGSGRQVVLAGDEDLPFHLFPNLN